MHFCAVSSSNSGSPAALEKSVPPQEGIRQVAQALLEVSGAVGGCGPAISKSLLQARGTLRNTEENSVESSEE